MVLCNNERNFLLPRSSCLTERPKFVLIDAIMNAHLRISPLCRIHSVAWCACVFSLALILSSAFLAQRCPDNVELGPVPEEQLDAGFQPHAYDPDDNTVLRRIRYSPDPAIWGPGPYPTVLTIHPGNFYFGEAYGVSSQRYATYDLVKAGFLVFQVIIASRRTALFSTNISMTTHSGGSPPAGHPSSPMT